MKQEFNSLDAQREACVAFIASQVGLGWKLGSDHYDDGGISGLVLSLPVPVVLNGERRILSAEEAFLLALRHRSRNGDVSAAELLAELADFSYSTQFSQLVATSVQLLPGCGSLAASGPGPRAEMRMARKFNHMKQSYMKLEPWLRPLSIGWATDSFRYKSSARLSKQRRTKSAGRSGGKSMTAPRVADFYPLHSPCSDPLENSAISTLSALAMRSSTSTDGFLSPSSP